MADPWDKKDGESTRAFAAFQTYLQMGYKRSLRKTAISLGHSQLRTVQKWSSQYDWVNRVAAYESYTAKESLKASRHKSAELTKKYLAIMELPAMAIAAKIQKDQKVLENENLISLFKMMVQGARVMPKLVNLEEDSLTKIIEADAIENDSDDDDKIMQLIKNNPDLGDKLNDIIGSMEEAEDDIPDDDG